MAIRNSNWYTDVMEQLEEKLMVLKEKFDEKNDPLGETLDYISGDLKKSIKVSKNIDELVIEEQAHRLIKQIEEEAMKKRIKSHANFIQGALSFDA